ncbi:MAG: PH domain-containing protein [Cyanobacteriota bacterium]
MTPSTPDPAASVPSATGAPVAGPPGGGLPGSANETVFYEGGPARGDLIFNLIFGLTLIGIPFAVGAVIRALWLRFRITSRRISVNGGWLGRTRTQVVYSQIREVRSVSRGLGFWGDMVLVLSDGAKLELRSVPRYREVETYVNERIAARAASVQRPSNGFAVQGDQSAA